MTPEGWRWLAFRHLWVWAPHLHSTGRRQAQRLASALQGVTHSFPGSSPVPGAWYPSRDRAVYPWDPAFPEAQARHTAWAVGYHAGRVMALRLEAYDRKRWPVRV